LLDRNRLIQAARLFFLSLGGDTLAAAVPVRCFKALYPNRSLVTGWAIYLGSSVAAAQFGDALVACSLDKSAQ